MKRIFKFITTVLTLIVLAFVGGTFFYGTKSVHDLLASNEKLKKAFANYKEKVG